MRTSRFFTPHSCASAPARPAATCAAKGVLLREPLKPLLPQVAQASVLPCRSVMVTIVLLNDACMCAMPSATFFLTFLRTRVLAFAMSNSSLACGDRLQHLDRRLARALAGARVGARALSAHRQAQAVALAAPGAEVDQPLDVHRDFAPQVALDLGLGDLLAQ